MILALTGWALAHADDPPEHEVLRLADALRSGGSLTRLHVEAVTGCRLRPDADASTGYFDVLNGSCPQGGVSGIELRVPTTAASARDGLVLLDVRRPPCVEIEAVARRYGAGEPVFPSPNAPAEEPMYLRYVEGSLRMSFGFQRAPPSCLSRIVIDRTGR